MNPTFKYNYFLILVITLSYISCKENPILFSPSEISNIKWEQLDGLYGGTVNCVKATPDGTLFAGTYNSMYLSTDQGESWKIGSLNHVNIKSILIDNNNNILAITSNTMYATSDKGKTWNERFIKLNLNIGSFFIDKQNNIFVVGTDYINAMGTANILFSSDFGITWKTLQIWPNRSINKLAIDSKGTLYVSLYAEGILKSYDSGKTWENIDINLTGENISDFIIEANDRIHIYSHRYGYGFSENGGKDWTYIKDGSPPNGISSFYKTTNGDLLASKNNNIYKLNRKSNGWDLLSQIKGQVNDISSGPDNILYVSTSINGVYKSKNLGLDWQQINNGLKGFNVPAIAIGDQDVLYACIENNGLYCSHDDGLSWTKLSEIFDNKNILEIITRYPNNVYVNSYNDGIYRSRDAGKNWENITRNISTLNINILAVNSKGYIYISPQDGRLLCTRNNGLSWNEIHNFEVPIVSIKTDNYDNIFISTTVNEAASKENKMGLYVSSNDGISWQIIDKGLSFSALSDISIGGNGSIFANSFYSLYRYDRNRTSWDPPKPMHHPSMIASFYSDSKGIVIFSSFDQIYISNDNAEHWIKTVPSTVDRCALSYVINSKGDIFVRTGCYGIYKSKR
jgi:photosystem II stability/assembly factor-like uncharacterized protein